MGKHKEAKKAAMSQRLKHSSLKLARPACHLAARRCPAAHIIYTCVLFIGQRPIDSNYRLRIHGWDEAMSKQNPKQGYKCKGGMTYLVICDQGCDPH